MLQRYYYRQSIGHPGTRYPALWTYGMKRFRYENDIFRFNVFYSRIVVDKNDIGTNCYGCIIERIEVEIYFDV